MSSSAISAECSPSLGAGIRTVGIASTQGPERLREAGVFMVAKDFTDPNLRALIGA